MSLKPVLALVFVLFSFSLAPAQAPVRLAILDLAGDESREITDLLRELAKGSIGGFELLDDDLIRLAARGAGYSGSMNLSREDASALGQSIGCDFYVLGKVQTARRLAAGEEFYFDALAGVFFVETRSGKLIRFAYEQAKAQQERKAMDQLKEMLKRNWPHYADAVLAVRELHVAAIHNVGEPSPPPVEVLTDDLAADGIQQPFFYQRIKPDYTEQADLAGIVATVELEAVFREDGTIGEIEIVRWAGFGLDESAVATVKKLRFKPAVRGEKSLTIKGLVRYNFRRPLSQAERQEEIERLKRSLQNIKQVPTQTSGPPKP